MADNIAATKGKGDPWLQGHWNGRWFAPRVDKVHLRSAGVKLEGGGPHQSKTIMLGELTELLTAGAADRAEDAILHDNLLGKPSIRARRAALYRLRQLYGIGESWPICVALRKLWERDPAGRPMLALLCALARDPTLRDGAAAVLDAVLGERVRWPAIAAAFEACNPDRLNEKMAKSLAQNAASTWTQAGFLKGAVRKERVRAKPSPATAAYAALLASLCGIGGMRLVECRWLDVLDRPYEDRLALLRQAEGLGLAKVRSVGDMLEIDVRRPLAEALGVPQLVDLEDLLTEFKNRLAVPWRPDETPAGRVWIPWYDKAQERRVRGRLREFQLAAEQAGKGWREFDIAPRFGEWVAQQPWFERLARRPGTLSTVIPQFEEHLADAIKAELASCSGNDILALTGVASLFGLTRASALIDKISGSIPGRLLVTFPGVHQSGIYRLLDARDGWNYLAVPIPSTDLL
jgi:hypothetical protein